MCPKQGFGYKFRVWAWSSHNKYDFIFLNDIYTIIFFINAIEIDWFIIRPPTEGYRDRNRRPDRAHIKVSLHPGMHTEGLRKRHFSRKNTYGKTFMTLKLDQSIYVAYKSKTWTGSLNIKFYISAATKVHPKFHDNGSFFKNRNGCP